MARERPPNRVIGVTSAVPGEGRSTIAAALALLAADAGYRTILIDCDLRNRSLSSLLTPAAKLGIQDVISGVASLDEVTWTDPSTNLVFLPALKSSGPSFASELIGSSALRDVVQMLRDTFDYVIVDLSPIIPFVDARVAGSVVDSYLFVIEWGRTNVSLVKSGLHMADEISDKVLGAILNKADMKSLSCYTPRISSYYPQHHV
jgi:capsular exopolysaccharide synthesis family protein